jgi:hypothetical protein
MAKSNRERDEEIEERIMMEIVVDAYNEDERAMGWYYYIEGTVQFPFQATCIVHRPISPLKVKDKVEVIGMPGESECECEVFVTIKYGDGTLAVPLAQLKPAPRTGKETKQAIDDWHYWVEMGYHF